MKPFLSYPRKRVFSKHRPRSVARLCRSQPPAITGSSAFADDDTHSNALRIPRDWLVAQQRLRWRRRARRARAAGRAGAAHRRAGARRPRTIRKDRPASRRSCRGCSNWAGPSAATCGSTLAGVRAMPTRFASYAAELVALAPDVILAAGGVDRGAVAAGDPHRADRVRQSSSIRSAAASSKAWRGRAVTPPGLPISNTASAGNGWSCSSRSRRA